MWIWALIPGLGDWAMITKIKLLLVALLLMSFQCNTRQIFDANGVLAFDVKNDTSAIYYSFQGKSI